MSTIGIRIKEARKAKGFNQSQLARSLGLSPQAVQSWESGKATPKNKNIQDLCALLGRSVDYFFCDESPVSASNEQYHSISIANPASLIHDGALEVVGRQLLAESEMNARSISFEHAICLSVSGNSLAPVIHHKSVVCIDRSSTVIVDGSIYALAHHGEVRLKIAYRLPGAGLRLSSFNKDEYADEAYTASEVEAQGIKMLGKVVWVSQFLP